MEGSMPEILQSNFFMKPQVQKFEMLNSEWFSTDDYLKIIRDPLEMN